MRKEYIKDGICLNTKQVMAYKRTYKSLIKLGIIDNTTTFENFVDSTPINKLSEFGMKIAVTEIKENLKNKGIDLVECAKDCSKFTEYIYNNPGNIHIYDELKKGSNISIADQCLIRDMMIYFIWSLLFKKNSQIIFITNSVKDSLDKIYGLIECVNEKSGNKTLTSKFISIRENNIIENKLMNSKIAVALPKNTPKDYMKHNMIFIDKMITIADLENLLDYTKAFPNQNATEIGNGNIVIYDPNEHIYKSKLKNIFISI